jgi:hypothetical protein
VASKKARRERQRQRQPPQAVDPAAAPAVEPAPPTREPDQDAPGDEVPKIDEPVIVRVLTNPKGYAPFLQFCCGKDRREESEVMVTVHNLWAGTTQIQQIAVLLEKDAPRLEHTGERPLVGICTIASAMAEQAYTTVGIKDGERGAAIGVVGTDIAYRKHVLSDGKTRPGVELVTGTLKLIEQMFGGAMPFVRTNVLPTNEGSKPLFDQHYFENTGYPKMSKEVAPGVMKVASSDNLALFRPAGLPPAQLRARSWSTRPISAPRSPAQGRRRT